jgi:ABC-2 type transport system permease protein
MSTATATFIAPTTVRPSSSTGPSLARLTRIELRKSVDTRAGRWLLVGVAAIGVALTFVTVLAGGASDHTFADGAGNIQGAMTILAPVLGILLITSEWSQRTALQTFALVPRRGRVVSAKLLAGAVLSQLVAVFGVALSLLATAVASHPASGSWHHLGLVVFGSLLVQLLAVLSGMAFGLLLLNSAVAIVLNFLVPTAWTIISTSIHALHGVRSWLDITRPSSDLLSGSMSGQRWAQLGVATLIWVVALLIAGVVRLRRKEIV